MKSNQRGKFTLSFSELLRFWTLFVGLTLFAKIFPLQQWRIVFHAPTIYDWQKTIAITVRISGGNPYSAYRCLCFRLHENAPAQRVTCTHTRLLSTSRFSLFHSLLPVRFRQHKQPNFDFENGNFPLFLFVSICLFVDFSCWKMPRVVCLHSFGPRCSAQFTIHTLLFGLCTSIKYLTNCGDDCGC